MSQLACRACDRGELPFQTPWIRKSIPEIHKLAWNTASKVNLLPTKTLETRNTTVAWKQSFKNLSRVFLDFTICGVTSVYHLAKTENDLLRKVEKCDQNREELEYCVSMNSEAL